MKQIKTNYIVREVREQHDHINNSVVLICDKDAYTKERRRIVIRDYKQETYELARMLVPGDNFVLVENVLTPAKESDEAMRTIDHIIVYFTKEKV